MQSLSARSWIVEALDWLSVRISPRQRKLIGRSLIVLPCWLWLSLAGGLSIQAAGYEEAGIAVAVIGTSIGYIYVPIAIGLFILWSEER